MNTQSRKNVLVIGGAGFIGSSLCELLLEKFNVICVDNYFSGSEEGIDQLLSHKHFEFVRHDINQPLDLASLTGHDRFQVAYTGLAGIFYCAHSSSPAVIKKYPVELMIASSQGLKNALDLAHTASTKLIFVSNSLVYGDAIMATPDESAEGLITHEELRPLMESLRFAETLIEVYRSVYSLEISVVRLGEVYGQRMRADDDRFISTIISAALRNEEIVIPSYCSRGAFLFSSDAVEALEKIWLEAPAGVYNVGSTATYDVREVVEKVIALTHSSSQLRIDEAPSARGDMWAAQMYPVAIDKIRESLAWFPVVLLDEGLGKTIDYMKARQRIKTFI